MDDNKYNKEIINYIKKFSSLDNTEENLVLKRRICVLVNGQSKNEDKFFKWNRSQSSGREDIVYKPQFIHSGAAIFMLIKYPHMRTNDSFINIIIESDLMNECLKIALDVLTADEDCTDFVTNSDFIFGSEFELRIIDETNDPLK
jgi:hypothetical protein